VTVTAMLDSHQPVIFPGLTTPVTYSLGSDYGGSALILEGSESYSTM